MKKRKKSLHNMVTSAMFATVLALVFTVSSCDEDSVDSIDTDALIEALGLESYPDVTHPANNPTSAAKVELGRLLFWDPIVSGHGDVACVTCHHPDHGYTDGIDLSIGVNGSGLGPLRTENTGGISINPLVTRVPRNAPTVLNAAYNSLTSNGAYDPELGLMFWDGRMSSLESQCQGPPGSRSEMRGDAYPEEETFANIEAKIAAIPEYVTLFDDVFGGGAAAVNVDNFAFAMGAFERSIVTDNSPFLQYVNGDMDAISEQAKQGLLLFFGDAGCRNCHSGPMFSDYNFHTLGIPDNPANPNGTDAGKDDLYRFRTQSLHNVSLTGPYSHSGMFSSLREMVRFMSSGTSQNPNVLSGMLDADFVDRNLTSDQLDDLVAFLETLADNDFDKTVPASVPSGLEVGGNIN